MLVQPGLAAETKYICNLYSAFYFAFPAEPPWQPLHIPNVLELQKHFAICFLQAYCIGFATSDTILPRALGTTVFNGQSIRSA